MAAVAVLLADLDQAHQLAQAVEQHRLLAEVLHEDALRELELEGGRVVPPGEKAHMTERGAELTRAVEGAYREAGLAPPSPAEIAQRLAANPAAVVGWPGPAGARYGSRAQGDSASAAAPDPSAAGADASPGASFGSSSRPTSLGSARASKPMTVSAPLSTQRVSPGCSTTGSSNRSGHS